MGSKRGEDRHKHRANMTNYTLGPFLPGPALAAVRSGCRTHKLSNTDYALPPPCVHNKPISLFWDHWGKDYQWKRSPGAALLKELTRGKLVEGLQASLEVL